MWYVLRMSVPAAYIVGFVWAESVFRKGITGQYTSVVIVVPGRIKSTRRYLFVSENGGHELILDKVCLNFVSPLNLMAPLNGLLF